jgi:hypothetical protein
MAIPYSTSVVVLRGLRAGRVSESLSTLRQLTEEDLQLDSSNSKNVVAVIPSKIQQLLDKYSDVFTSKVCYPSPIRYSHYIPLISGYRPINIRHYRYAPALMTEIEKQVQ